MTNNIIIQFTESEFKDLLLACIAEGLGKITPPDKKQSDKLFNVKEAAEYLDLAPQTLYGFTSGRTIPFIKKGKRLYFKESDLEKWLASGRRKTQEEIHAELNKEKGGKHG